jgi:hypothetical protein
VDEVAERAERLIDIDGLVRSVDLVQIDVVRAQSAQAVLALGNDPAARVPLRVGIIAHGCMDLGGQHHSRSLHGCQRLAHDDLGLAGRIDVSGVDEVDAGIEGTVDDPDGVFVIGIAPLPEHHRPEAERADLDTGSTECADLHETNHTARR